MQIETVSYQVYQTYQIYETVAIGLATLLALWGLFHQMSGRRLLSYLVCLREDLREGELEREPSGKESSGKESLGKGSLGKGSLGKELSEKELSKSRRERAAGSILESCWIAQGAAISFCGILGLFLLIFSDMSSFPTHLTLLLSALFLLITAVESLVSNWGAWSALSLLSRDARMPYIGIPASALFRNGALLQLGYSLYLLGGAAAFPPLAY